MATAKLPDIEYGNAPQDNSGQMGLVNAAKTKTFDTLEKGIGSFAESMIKNQQQKAKVELYSQLNDITNKIGSQDYFSTKDVKEALGPDFDKLDSKIKSQLYTQGLDIKTGKPMEFDREDIPSWVVAGSMFDALSARAVGAAGENITVGGWRADFQDAAKESILQRKMKLNEDQMKKLDSYLGEQEASNALGLANVGEFGQARESLLNGSKHLDPAMKEKLIGNIDKMEQLAPVYEAIQRDDYGKMAELLGHLNDPKQYGALTAQ